MGHLIVGAVQIACSDNTEANLDKLEIHVREAARRGAKLVVLQELFEGPYFCIDIDAIHNKRAKPFKGHNARCEIVQSRQGTKRCTACLVL